ncbi:trifunctional histidinol dehydrogenase [Tieghemiomyces parasiticus]|uniref:Histidine biosynthesis trifunctional protein n=1 Tax=Tieghemiomyces parasiticus TaxID=78921 RepID=A0A9W8AHB4_9FUNG|nr:trifunctional histidinol dehydrogenase [Tieghemiomyces parasiticus]
MLIPAFTIAGEGLPAVDSGLAYLNTLLLTLDGGDATALRTQATRAVAFHANDRGGLWAARSTPGVDVDADVALLDAGFAKVVTDVTLNDTDFSGADGDDSILTALQTLPADRRVLRFTAAESAALTGNTFTKYWLPRLVDTARTVVIRFPASSAPAPQQVLLLVLAAKQRLESTQSSDSALQWVVEFPTDHLVDVALLETLSRNGLDAVVDTHRLTTAYPAPTDQLNLAEALLAGSVSDRSDGLLPTVVVNEQHVNLGLVYTSAHSLSEALRTGTGVYQSRKRGLWYKGQTSGATQTLRAVNLDCDADALEFTVAQTGAGFCHLDRLSCFGSSAGLAHLMATLQARRATAPAGSYTQRLFTDPALLHAKIAEEAQELCDATSTDDIAWETADLLYFALAKCTVNGVDLGQVEQHLNRRARKVTRRPGNAKPQFLAKSGTTAPTPTAAAPAAQPAPVPTPAPVTTTASSEDRICMQNYRLEAVDATQYQSLLERPIIRSDTITATVEPILKRVRAEGDVALKFFTEKFDRVALRETVLRAPFPKSLQAGMTDRVRRAIDQAYDNVRKFHAAQLPASTLEVETMPGVVCSRFSRPIERVGLYVPGGTAVLPSSALMLGVPAQVAGCREIVLATPPRPDGSIVPEVVYVAEKVGASTIVIAGGAQAVAAMAFGTESVPKVDKICGPGNQFVTAAKMLVQNDHSAMVGIDMPAGPSELLVIADANANPAYVASDLLSQAEHGPDSQVVLVTVDLNADQLRAIEDEIHQQATRLPRVDVVRQSIPKSYSLAVATREAAVKFSNAYAPEHLILHVDTPGDLIPLIDNAGSVFVGPYSPESCGDYASGTNHTLPTYGYSRMYSGVNTDTFLKHITAQTLTAEGLDRIGDTVMDLAEVEGLEAHRNAVAIRLAELRKTRDLSA